jgi:hypothetical protein
MESRGLGAGYVQYALLPVQFHIPIGAVFAGSPRLSVDYLDEVLAGHAGAGGQVHWERLVDGRFRATIEFGGRQLARTTLEFETGGAWSRTLTERLDASGAWQLSESVRVVQREEAGGNAQRVAALLPLIHRGSRGPEQMLLHVIDADHEVITQVYGGLPFSAIVGEPGFSPQSVRWVIATLLVCVVALAVVWIVYLRRRPSGRGLEVS